ncbi:hypothetical protein V6R21_24205 [Limibacter armeniacum]|uniref:hypothetical protein n=1 Tax=Limibacter armeniacum TaxID=466084 RepID=UPI002FE58F82
MELYKSDYMTISYLQDSALLELVWHEPTRDMSDEQFKHEIMVYSGFHSKKKPLKTLTDHLHFHFYIHQGLQDWMKDHAFPKGIPPNQVSAFVEQDDFFLQVAVEQALEEVDEVTENLGNVKHFATREDALNWLLK